MSGGNVPPYVGGPWTVDRTGPDLIFRAPVRSGPVQHAPMLGPVRSRSCSLSPGPVRSGPVALGGSVHGPGWTESCPNMGGNVTVQSDAALFGHCITRPIAMRKEDPESSTIMNDI